MLLSVGSTRVRTDPLVSSCCRSPAFSKSVPPRLGINLSFCITLGVILSGTERSSCDSRAHDEIARAPYGVIHQESSASTQEGVAKTSSRENPCVSLVRDWAQLG